MNEGLYSDTYVRSRLTPQKRLQRNLMLAACVVVPVIGIGFLGGWLPLLLSLIIDVVLIWFLPPKKIDYEYVFVDGQIDFDRIIADSSRKNMMRTDLEKAEIVAPEDSHSLDSYKKLRLLDYSSGALEDKHYIIVVKTEKDLVRIRFTPDGKLLEQMKLKARSKIEY